MKQRIELTYSYNDNRQSTYTSYSNIAQARSELRDFMWDFFHTNVKILNEKITKISNEEYYSEMALRYAEKYGIIEYKVKGNEMIYYSSFPIEHSTIRANVNLDTNKEIRTRLKRYFKSYHKTIGGIKVNYMA